MAGTLKIIVTKKGGVRRGGQVLEPGEHEVPSGPHVDAWLRFGEAKLVEKSKKGAASSESEKAPKKDAKSNKDPEKKDA